MKERRKKEDWEEGKKQGREGTLSHLIPLSLVILILQIRPLRSNQTANKGLDSHTYSFNKHHFPNLKKTTLEHL